MTLRKKKKTFSLTAELICVETLLSKTKRRNAVDEEESFLSDEVLLLRLAIDRVSLPPSIPMRLECIP